MRVKLKKLLCLLCVLTLLFTSAGVLPALALNETGDADAEMSVNPGASGEAKEESGLFVMTGLNAAPGEESAQEAESVPGKDAQSATETVSEPGKPPEPVSPSEVPTLMDGSSVVTPDATPTLELSVTQVSKKVGETASVTVTISGYPSGAYLQASNSNSAAYACVWGSWNQTSIPIRITGKNDGGGVLTLSLKDTNNKTLVSKTVNVTIVADKPTLSFSPSSLSLKAGGSGTSTLTINNYSGGGSISASVANGSVCSVRWGSWSGWSIPITVTGKSAGSTKVTVRLFNSVKTELASVTLNVVVTQSATLSVSTSSVSVYAGESSVVTATANGTLSNGDCFKYSVANSSVATVTSSGSGSAQSLRLLVAGRSKGSTTLTVSLCSQSGQVLDTKTVSIAAADKTNNQRVSVSPASVTVKVGSSVKVNCTGQNVSGAFSLRYVNNSSSLLDCSWRDNWSGNTVPVTITGKSGGNGSVTIQLLVGGSVVSTATIQVKVEGDNGGGGNNGGGSVGQSPSYSFSNYSKPGISLALCQYMFGNTQKAKTVYSYDIGNGGVCFGMSTTSGLLSSSNAPSPSVFGKSSMTALQKTNYNSAWGLSLSDFIEAMHITQVSTSMKELSGISAMVNAVRSGGTSQPVIICVRGPGGGHAILGYGVDSSGSIIVYDSNWPGQARKVNISGNSWSYELWSGKVWNSSNGRISYIPYSTYSQVWANRGYLKGAVLQDGGLLNDEDPSRYLLATTAHDFELAVFDENSPNAERVIAVYKNGVLNDDHDPVVEEVFIGNAPLNSDGPAPVHMLYVPGEDLYTVHNLTGESMDVTLSGNGLSVHVNSEAESFDLAVSDAEDFASAQLSGLEEGQQYSISVGTSHPADGEPDEAQIEGVGNGQPICMGIGEGLGVGMEGLYISNGAGDGMLSLNAVGDEDAEKATSLSMDFALNATNFDTEYPLTAEAGEGGQILPQDGQPADNPRSSVTTVLEGGNHTFRIRPDNGYTLKAVYVNGVEAVYSEAESDQPTYSYYDGAYEYTFRDVREPGYLYAEFAKDINQCQVKADYDAGNLTVTVTDGDKVLLESVDYDWSVSNVTEDGENKTYLTVQAVAGGDYNGVLMEPYDYHTEDNDPALIVTASNPDETTLLVKNVENPFVMAIAYADPAFPNAGQMLAVLPGTIGEKTADGITVRISRKDAQLSGAYALKAFLFSDADAMRVLCDPVNIGGGGGSSSGGGGGGSTMTYYYLNANAVKEGPADGAVWLSRVQPTAENIEAITNKVSSLNLAGTTPNVIFYAVMEAAPGVNADYAVNSGSVVNAEEIAGRKVLTIRANAYPTPMSNPLTLTATFA